MAAQYFFNGKPVRTKPKKGKLIRIVHEQYYGDEAYIKQQEENAYKYFAKQREIREDMDKYHG